MFIGHYAVALAAKKVTPKLPLALMFFAAQFLDLLWPLLVLTGFENFSIDPGNTKFTPLNFENYPISHSLLTVLAWSLLVGSVYFIAKKDFRNSLVLGGLVLSHWLLDFFTHRPDLPLYPGSANFYGLGLWNSVWGTAIFEVLLYGGGVYLYIKYAEFFKAKIFWFTIIFLMIIYISNMLGPVPPSVEMVTYSALILWVFIPLAFFTEKR